VPFRTAGVADSVTVTTKNTAGQLVTPVSTPVVKWYTDAARTLGETTLTTSGSGSTYTTSWTAGQAPATSATRYLKVTIEVSTGVYDVDADDTIVFVDAVSEVDGGLCTLAEVKLQLNKLSADDDDELQSYIDAVTAPVEDYCGAVLQQTVTNEQHNSVAGSSLLVLRNERVASVTSVTEYVGTTGYTLTQITTPAQAAAYTYILDGTVLHRMGGGGASVFTGPVYVTYVAGFTSVPAAINLAARIIVQHLWRTQNGGADLPALSDEETIGLPGFSFAIPTRAKELLDRYRRTGGFA
jgi:hypothetical protein